MNAHEVASRPAPSPAEEKEFKDGLLEAIPYVRAFARTLCGSKAPADDLAQETLTKAWAARNSFQPGTNLKAWLFMIARNQFYSEKRRSWRSVAWDEDLAEARLVAPATQSFNVDLTDLRRALTKITPEQREALVLVGAGGLSYEEAAKVCGCAIGTVKSRVARARQALERMLNGADPDALPGRHEVPQSEDLIEEAQRITETGGGDPER
ncbi:MAG: sigma-70 family RNA polymerase sigma factor [Alphaproteobacteria bacterium]|nr:sigma-70 family RNA polymerase sigma factor [Alphaproteobacteria bacterium]